MAAGGPAVPEWLRMEIEADVLSAEARRMLQEVVRLRRVAADMRDDEREALREAFDLAEARRAAGNPAVRLAEGRAWSRRRS